MTLEFHKLLLGEDNLLTLINNYTKNGWVVTDGSYASFQVRKEIKEDEVYLFREHRIVNPLTKEIGIYESEMNINDYDWWDIVEACEAFGYNAKEVDKWIVSGDETPLILECLFEQET